MATIPKPKCLKVQAPKQMKSKERPLWPKKQKLLQIISFFPLVYHLQNNIGHENLSKVPGGGARRDADILTTYNDRR